MQRNIWPGLALAGGVLVAAMIALLLLGSSSGGLRGEDTSGPPHATNPSNTRIFPGYGPVAGPIGSP